MNEIIKKNGITFGIIAGAISVLITTLIYIIDIKLFASIWVGLSGLAISILLAIILLSKTKKELNGQLTFKEAFTTYFVMAVVSILITVTFNIILFNFIDPSLSESVKEIILESTIKMMKKFGAEKQAINEAIKTMNETDNFSVGSQLKGLLTNIVVSSIFGLILAAFFKTPTRQEI